MKQLNFTIRIVGRTFIAFIITVAVYMALYSVAYAERGYHAVGGEALIALIVFLVILVKSPY